MRTVSAAAVVLVGVALVSPRRCLAAADERFSLRGELGAGAMLSSHQREDLGFDWGGEGSLRLGFSLAGPLVLQLGASHWMFPDGVRKWTILNAAAAGAAKTAADATSAARSLTGRILEAR